MWLGPVVVSLYMFSVTLTILPSVNNSSIFGLVNSINCE